MIKSARSLPVTLSLPPPPPPPSGLTLQRSNSLRRLNSGCAPPLSRRLPWKVRARADAAASRSPAASEPGARLQQLVRSAGSTGGQGVCCRGRGRGCTSLQSPSCASALSALCTLRRGSTCPRWAPLLGTVQAVRGSPQRCSPPCPPVAHVVQHRCGVSPGAIHTHAAPGPGAPAPCPAG